MTDRLFDVGKPKEEPAPHKNKSANAPKKYRAGLEIHYAGQRLVLPEEKTEDQVFAFLNDNYFPEVTPDRANLRHDKEKDRLVVALSSFKKGTEDLPLPSDADPPVRRIRTRWGDYKVRATGAGLFYAPLDAAPPPRPAHALRHGRAPLDLFDAAVSLFRARRDREVVLEIIHDRRGAGGRGSFHLVYPSQRDATAGSVTYDPFPESEDIAVCVNLHSHGLLPAYFSATDDEYELKSGLYGVVGDLGGETPSAAFRSSCDGYFAAVPLEALFDEAR